MIDRQKLETVLSRRVPGAALGSPRRQHVMGLGTSGKVETLDDFGTTSRVTALTSALARGWMPEPSSSPPAARNSGVAVRRPIVGGVSVAWPRVQSVERNAGSPCPGRSHQVAASRRPSG